MFLLGLGAAPEQDGNKFLAGCLTMAIFLRADLHRCAGHRIIAGDAVSKSGG